MSRNAAYALSGCLTLAWATPARAGAPERPPVQRPVVQPEPDLEPEPDPAPTSDTPTTATLDVPPSDAGLPTELVQPEAALPSFDDPTIPVVIDPAAETEPPPLRAVPLDGRGRLAIGGLLIGAGAATLASSVALEADGAPPKYWAPMVAAGITGAVVGSVLIVFGHRHLRSYREWEAGQTESIPRQGLGLVAPACVMMVGGAALAVGGAGLWMDQDSGFHFPWDYSLPAPEAALGIGVGSFVIGATLMGIGAARSKRFTTWRRDTSNPTAYLHLTPIFGPVRGGAQIGLSSRF